ncbi:MAG: DUF5107 domain-containing protein [Acidobacteriota bacterium]
MRRVLWFALSFLVPVVSFGQGGQQAVQVSHGRLEVPTYTFGRTETGAPLFKSVPAPGHYPYTALDRDSLSAKPVPVKYESLTLENEYLKVVFLPELGGRLWSAHDKVANREVFYYTSVIKPSRYNQRGAWPVGNLEVYGPYDAHMLTWPGEPWPWALKRNADGSASVVLSHIDHFFRNKVSLEVTLRPGRTFLETTIKLWNGNLLPNRYLLWTNAGVPATEGTRFVYPMTRTIGHDTSELGTWPVVDGVDLSWYKNNKNMLGVFGLDLYDHFIAAYDYQQDYGTVCTADRLLARGVKTWTWGTGPAAVRHMESYTDGNVPYIEVQSGRFVWDGNYEFINPGKSDGWTEYWYGIGGLGGLSSASRDAALFLNLPEGHRGRATLAVTPTGNFAGAELELLVGEAQVWKIVADLAVGQVFKTAIELPESAAHNVIILKVTSREGRSLAYYSAYPKGTHPNAVYAGDAIPRKFGPVETLSAEEAFQKGLGHEKFGQLEEARKAYEAALSKDEGFAAAHLQLGLMALERTENRDAISHFEKTLNRDPVQGDAHYYLAVAQMELGHLSQARRHYYRLLPSSDKFDQRDYGLGLLALATGDWGEAGQRLAAAARTSPLNLSVRQAYTYYLRKSGTSAAARDHIAEILEIDPTNAFAHGESLFLSGASAFALEAVDRACARHAQGYLELASEYLRLSAWQEAGQILDRGMTLARAAGEDPYPMLFYYRAYAAAKAGDQETAEKSLAAAREHPLDLQIYPFRRESVRILNWALDRGSVDANASTLLGDMLYHFGRRDEAFKSWRRALKEAPAHFFALRDLGLGLLELGDATEALPLLTKASEVRPQHLPTTILVARLSAQTGRPEAARLAFQRALQAKPGNDQLIEGLAAVEVQLGNPERALDLLSGHQFEPRHQSYSLLRLYQATRLMLALKSAKAGQYDQALRQIQLAGEPSSNLGMDDFAALKSARLSVFQALVQEAKGEDASAVWKAAADTADDDVEGEGLFRAIGLWKSGKRAEAMSWLKGFEKLNPQRQHDSSVAVRTQALMLEGIYAVFRGDRQTAADRFVKALEADPSNLFTRLAGAWLEAGLLEKLAS